MSRKEIYRNMKCFVCNILFHQLSIMLCDSLEDMVFHFPLYITPVTFSFFTKKTCLKWVIQLIMTSVNN